MDSHEIVPRQPLQNLDQLELVVEVGLEPEDDLTPGRGETRVPLLQVAQDPIHVGRLPEEFGAAGAQVGVVEAGRDRALVKDVPPGQDLASELRALDPVGGAIPVRDVE